MVTLERSSPTGCFPDGLWMVFRQVLCVCSPQDRGEPLCLPGRAVAAASFPPGVLTGSGEAGTGSGSHSSDRLALTTGLGFGKGMVT